MTERYSRTIERLRTKFISLGELENTANDAADAIEALQASLALCERRAEAGEALALFFQTELERILKEAGK